MMHKLFTIAHFPCYCRFDKLLRKLHIVYVTFGMFVTSRHLPSILKNLLSNVIWKPKPSQKAKSQRWQCCQLLNKRRKKKKNSPRRWFDFHLGPGRAALPHRERGFVRGRRIDRWVATPAEGPRPARRHQCVQTAGRRLTAHRRTLCRAGGGAECGSSLATGTESAGRAGGHCVGSGAGAGGHYFWVTCGRDGKFKR